MRAYKIPNVSYTVVIPYPIWPLHATVWHGDSDPSSGLHTVTRGMWHTEAEGHAWAARNIPGHVYHVRRDNCGCPFEVTTTFLALQEVREAWATSEGNYLSGSLTDQEERWYDVCGRAADALGMSAVMFCTQWFPAGLDDLAWAHERNAGTLAAPRHWV